MGDGAWAGQTWISAETLAAIIAREPERLMPMWMLPEAVASARLDRYHGIQVMPPGADASTEATPRPSAG